MLFDLRSGARRRTVKVVYLGLALLMFVGFVGFSIGSSGLSGGIVDAITGNGSTGGGDDAAVERLTTQVQTADAKTKAAPERPRRLVRARAGARPPRPASATTSTPRPATTPPRAAASSPPPAPRGTSTSR